MMGCNHLFSLAYNKDGKTTYCWVCKETVDDDARGVWGARVV